MPLLEKGQPQNSSLNFNKITYKDWIHLPRSRALGSGDTIRQSAYPLLYGKDKVRGIKMLTIKGPATELFWRALSHLTLQLKNKCSKLKHPDPFGNEQLQEKLYHLSPSERWRQGHGCFYKGFFFHCKLRNGMRSPGKKRGKYQTKTPAISFSKYIYNHNPYLLNGFTGLIKWLFFLTSSKFFS